MGQLINLIYKYSASSAATPDQPCLQTVPPPGGLAMTSDHPLYWLVTVKLNQQVAVLSVGEPDIHQVDNVMTNPYLLKLLILF